MYDQHDTSIVFRKPSRPTSITRPCKASFGENAIECRRKSSWPHSFLTRSNTCSIRPSAMTSSGMKIGASSALASGSPCFLAFLFLLGTAGAAAQCTKCLSAAPCDRLIIGDADDQTLAAFEGDLGLGKNRDVHDVSLVSDL